jgi:hypothetical protein
MKMSIVNAKLGKQDSEYVDTGVMLVSATNAQKPARLGAPGVIYTGIILAFQQVHRFESDMSYRSRPNA